MKTKKPFQKLLTRFNETFNDISVRRHEHNKNKYLNRYLKDLSDVGCALSLSKKLDSTEIFDQISKDYFAVSLSVRLQS